MGITIQYNTRMSGYITVLAMAMICMVDWHTFAGSTNTLTPQPNPSVAVSANSLPARIITTDGKTYNEVTLLKIQPDGLLVQYQPDTGGLGLTTLKFDQLPVSLQKQFGYDFAKASAFEQSQKRATGELSQKLRQQDEQARVAQPEDTTRIDPSRFVKVSSSDPTVTYEYYAPDQKPDSMAEGISICQHTYQCQADFDFHSQPGGPDGKQIYFYVDAVRISLGLNCHIIEPENPYDRIRRYEEANRSIYEYFYRFAPQVANNIGESMIGELFVSPETDFETAKAQALRDADANFNVLFRVRFDTVATKAKAYFQKLTDYDENDVNTDQAVQAAIAKYNNSFSN